MGVAECVAVLFLAGTLHEVLQSSLLLEPIIWCAWHCQAMSAAQHAEALLPDHGK